MQDAKPPETSADAVESYFPLATPREKQIKALQFIQRAVDNGVQDIVIAAPTGIGKTGIGIAACLWAVRHGGEANLGGYYLVTQKLLQDQIDQDFQKFEAKFAGTGASLKSAVEYPCDRHGTCMVGARTKPPCPRRREELCPYKNAYFYFRAKPVSVTNYPFFMTERTYVQQLPQRRVLVMDECHTIEKQVLGFVEVSVGGQELEEWAPHLRPLPELETADDFCDWLTETYVPVLNDRHEMLKTEAVASRDNKLHRELQLIENHIGRIQGAVDSLQTDPDNWVYWQESEGTGELRSTAKPIEAAPYTKELLFGGGATRIYMSAYPGPKKVFCRSLGLDASKVAWCSLASTFPVENRRIHLFFVGSMGRNSLASTTPGLLRMIEKIMTKHADEKGVIHCNSYKLGAAIHSHLMGTEHALRILYPTKAHQRETMLREHTNSREPTVLLSPSMTEGFSMDDELARWQIIAKCPYPYLGDRQVAAKRDRDPSWYAMQTAMTIIQACGRIVRSDADWGTTYILDSDFEGLLNRHPDFFPPWFQQAFAWH